MTEETTIKHLISWGFNQTTGELYLDSFLNVERYPEAVKHLFLRADFQKTNISLISLPLGADRSDIDIWFSVDTKDALKKLNKSKIMNPNQILRKKEESNTLDFLLHQVR